MNKKIHIFEFVLLQIVVARRYNESRSTYFRLVECDNIIGTAIYHLRQMLSFVISSDQNIVTLRYVVCANAGFAAIVQQTGRFLPTYYISCVSFSCQFSWPIPDVLASLSMLETICVQMASAKFTVYLENLSGGTFRSQL